MRLRSICEDISAVHDGASNKALEGGEEVCLPFSRHSTVKAARMHIRSRKTGKRNETVAHSKESFMII